MPHNTQVGCWVVVTPALVITITVFGFTDRVKDQHEGYEYPWGAQVRLIYFDKIFLNQSMHHHLCLQMLAYLVELSPVVFVLLVAVYVTVDRYLYRYLTISIISTISTISTSTTAACAARRASC